MGKPEEEVKLKWKNLRDKFCKAKKRMAKRNFSPPTDDDTPLERPVPGAGSGDDLEKEQDKDEKHGPLPVVSTSFSVVESSPNNHQEMGVSLKRKRQTTTETEISSADALTNLRDEDELFLLSLLPSLKRLTIKKRMEVRMKFQQVLYAAEFED
ncbi:hypothetical protein D9C73_004054 [Collichthys lucidus]|uniref:BESS domain-containing protein n=1 Tax=Collichthys lucidus TaxID=240159 RepID=A0A4U5U6S1_COLLU|nr:hypothetical protein D9C73_004054 [Collichthys lucidus]